MKKLFLTLVIAFAGIFTANAQVWLGGSLGGYTNKHDARLTISPEIGYSFANSHWTIATAAEFSYVNDKDLQTSNTSFALNPYVRYSMMNVEKFNIFMDLTADLALAGYPEFGYRIALQPGAAWMATEHWTAAFRFGILGYDNKGYFSGHQGFNFGFATVAPSFGLYYNF